MNVLIIVSMLTLESGFFQLCLFECLVNVSIIVDHVHAGVRILSAMDFGARPYCQYPQIIAEVVV